MSQENVELAWRAAQAWNEGGVDALVQYLDADVEWLPPRESMEPGIYRGHDGVRDYLGRLSEIFGNVHTEPLEVIEINDEHVIAVICDGRGSLSARARFWDVGPSVVAAVRVTARGRQTAIPVEQRIAQAWTIRDGKAIRIRTYASLSEALEAVGLAE